MAIEAEGWQIAGDADNGMQALEILPYLNIDLILFSIGNPSMRDLQSLSILRQAWPNLPILALTANEVEGQEQAALQNGAQDALSKAEPRANLIEHMHQILSNT